MYSFISWTQRWAREALGPFIHKIIFDRQDSSPWAKPIFRLRAAWNKSRKSLSVCPAPLRAKAYVIRTLLLCDWSVQQSANKPQTQKERNVVWVKAAVGGGEALRDEPKTAAEETNNWRVSCKKGVYRFFSGFSFSAGSQANFWQTDLCWHEKHRPVIDFVGVCFVFAK